MLTDLLNGEQDHVYADPVLLSTYGVAMEIVNTSQSSRVIMLNTVAEGVTPTAFEEVHSACIIFYTCANSIQNSCMNSTLCNDTHCDPINELHNTNPHG